MMSLSCSTTIIELPIFFNSIKDSINLLLSLWCRPMLGSSRMYKTPTSFEPICVASLILCDSPPDNVFEPLLKER